MIDNMYSIMRRISDLKERFGLMPPKKPIETPENSFENELNIRNREFISSGRAPSEYTKEDINKIAEHFALQNGISPALIKSMIAVESSFNPTAISPKGAMGLMQLMPATAGEMNVSDPFSPIQNIEAGTGYFRMLLDRYDDDVTKALAAYNAGMGRVDRAGGVPNIRETKNYIDRVISTYQEHTRR